MPTSAAVLVNFLSESPHQNRRQRNVRRFEQLLAYLFNRDQFRPGASEKTFLRLRQVLQRQTDFLAGYTDLSCHVDNDGTRNTGE